MCVIIGSDSAVVVLSHYRHCGVSVLFTEQHDVPSLPVPGGHGHRGVQSSVVHRLLISSHNCSREPAANVQPLSANKALFYLSYRE